MRYAFSVLTVCLCMVFPATLHADTTFESLQRDFQNLYSSLQAQGGISPADEALIDRFRQRVVAFNDQNPDHLVGTAMELQTAAWMQDHDRVDRLYARLVRLAPDDAAYGRAWVNYFLRQQNDDRVDAIYQRLLELKPYDADTRLSWARRLKGRNQYLRAIDALEHGSLDPVRHPEAKTILSDCLFAEHRFEEAVAALESIPESAMEAKPHIRNEVDRVLPERRNYIEQWAKEQALRAAEAQSNTLPQVELVIPERGRIVVELFEDHAPNHVANFITLVEEGFYDGTAFHRVIANFMAQGGDPNSKPGSDGLPGTGGPGYRIADEVHREDHRLHFGDSLAMAKEAAPDTGGSQFYLTVQPTPHLNGIHTVFGRIVEGVDVARSIQQNDMLAMARVLRKRDHEYAVNKLTGPRTPVSAPASISDGPDVRDMVSPNPPQPRKQEGQE